MSIRRLDTTIEKIYSLCSEQMSGYKKGRNFIPAFFCLRLWILFDQCTPVRHQIGIKV